jgi:hypothetical protein
MYTEPWGWMLPARHPNGALSLEHGLVEQAAHAYAEDLGLEGRLTRAHQHPKRPGRCMNTMNTLSDLVARMMLP